jgi:MFS family permease
VATWLIGFGTSLLGDQVFYVALTWAAVQVTTPGKVGLILVGNAVARALVLLIGGVLVDRVGPKRLVIGSDAARTVTMLAMAAIFAWTTPDVVLLVVLAIVFGIVDGFFLPAVGALPVYLAPPELMTRMQALKSVVTRTAMFAGAPLASLLIVTGSVQLAFTANAVLFGVSVAALLATVVLPLAGSGTGSTGTGTGSGPAERWWQALRRDIRDGLRVIGRDPTLRTLVILVGVLELGFAGPITAGVPLLAAESGWGVTGVGWVLGGFGIGAAVAAGYLAVRRSTPHAGLVALAGLATVSLSIFALGVVARATPDPAAAVIAAGAAGLVAGLGAGVFGTLINSALVTLAPQSQVGRVMAVVVLAGDLAMPISLAATGWITEWSNAALPFILGGGLMVAAAAFAITRRNIRGIELRTPERAEPAPGSESGSRARGGAGGASGPSRRT